MKKIGIFYGSSTGTTAKIAQKIGAALNVRDNDIHDVERVGPSRLGEYEVLMLGSSTYTGDLQSDWFDFANGLKALDLKGKTIAVFGCGNEKMAASFCNAVGIIYDMAKETGAEVIGEFPGEGFTFRKSKAKIDDSNMMKGLVIDEVNHSDMTDGRIKEWAAIIEEAAK